MNKKIWIGAGIAAAVAAMVTIAVVQKSRAEGPVKVTRLEQKMFVETLTTSGTLTAGKQQAVYLEPDRGDLKKILVKQGQKVKAGDRLIEYENPTLDAERDQAELQIKTAKVKLDGLYKQKKQLKQTPPPSSVSGQILAANQGGSPGSGKDEIEQQIRLARLELDQAEKQLDMVKAKESRLFVTSEQNGTVVQVNENAGAGTGGAATAAEPLVVVADLSQLKVTANVSEYDAIKVKAGQSVTIKTDAILDKEWTAKVEQVGFLPKTNQVAASADQDAQVTYPVDIKLEEAVPMKIGSRLIIEITTSKERVKGLPQSAVKENGEQNFVFVVEKGKAVQKPVKIGRSNGDIVEILSGISADQPVIVNPPADLRTGMEVEIR
ncbi:efflux RND transporter periplasmic adaptor subunit [Lihuaxuella thermophila]|uniref:HlyD family secretion protein n=1 Tax=Lihuaxuella thermophila TaxID=1173111 RepID=A0A1H8HSR7_9BACL|nr:efflux RND transporter periplasmic adaptor subunit [Lihuaxuella thermophila]SEN59154.1 HlyD family secretion protein [Lihuaxuella thermophila]